MNNRFRLHIGQNFPASGFLILLALLGTACAIIPPNGDETATSTLTETGTSTPDLVPPVDPTLPAGDTAADLGNWLTYTDQAHLFSFQYPPNWSLELIPTEGDVVGGESTTTVLLCQDTLRLVIQNKKQTEATVLGPAGLPAGEIEERGTIKFFDQDIPRNVLVFDEKDKAVIYNSRIDELEFYIMLDDDFGPAVDYREIEILQDVQIEVDRILSTFVRNEEPVIPPTSEPTKPATTTHTPDPTSTLIPTPTPVPTPCNRIGLVEDVTISEGTLFTPGTPFTKVWRLRNTGTCTWGTNYDLVFMSGDIMSGPTASPISGVVPPGYTIDIPVDLIAPWTAGDYIGLWKLRSPDGEVFGSGEFAENTFWVNIAVAETNFTNTIDFATNACSAGWRSGARLLPCPGSGYSKDGHIFLSNKPHLENRKEDEPTIILHPNEAPDGWISGTYPWIMLKESDYFHTWVGCMANNERCDITFHLDYQLANGVVWSLGSWRETYDGQVTQIYIDLADLAGETVRFILSVEVNSAPEAAHGFWFVPHIQRP